MSDYLLSADVAVKIPLRHVVYSGHGALSTVFLSILVWQAKGLIMLYFVSAVCSVYNWSLFW